MIHFALGLVFGDSRWRNADRECSARANENAKIRQRQHAAKVGDPTIMMSNIYHHLSHHAENEKMKTFADPTWWVGSLVGCLQHLEAAGERPL